MMVESDALSLILQLQSGKLEASTVDVMYDDIRSLVRVFSSVLSSHVKHWGNTVAPLARIHPNDGQEQFTDVILCRASKPSQNLID